MMIARDRSACCVREFSGINPDPLHLLLAVSDMITLLAGGLHRPMGERRGKGTETIGPSHAWIWDSTVRIRCRMWAVRVSR